MEKYTHFRHTLNSNGSIIPVDQILQNISTPNSDFYANLFSFDSNVIDYFNNNNKSISGYSGKALSDKLVFDFDHHTNLEIARKDAVTLLEGLEKVGADKAVTVFFSGSKGFHVEITTTHEYSPEEMKAICSGMCGEMETFDDSIYTLVRAFRLPNTKHNKSGLFKVCISKLELKDLTIDQIKELASKPSDFEEVIEPTNHDFRQYIAAKPAKRQVIVTDSSADENGIVGLDQIDFTQIPKGMPRCFFALSKGIMVPGERSRMFHILAKYYRNQGYEKVVTHRILKGVAELNSQLYPDAKLIDKIEIWNEHCGSAYSSASLKHKRANGTGTSEDNELLKKYCTAIKSDCKCTLHSKADASILQIGDVSSLFESYASNLDANTITTGIEFIDNDMQITVGTTTLLVGATGSGKTSVSLNMLETSNLINQPSMFFSMDMHKTLVYQKLAQKVTNYTGKQIKEYYATKNRIKIDEIKNAVTKSFGKTYFDFSSTLTLEEMESKVKSVNEKHPDNPIRLVIVDYSGRISGPHADSYANGTFNALRSTGIASDTNAAWIYLCQISRAVGDGNMPLRTKRAAKDTGSWEESATNVITMWRPFMGIPEKDQVMRMFLAKNRMGKEVEAVLHWNGAKGSVTDMSEAELGVYEESWALSEPKRKL